MPFVSARYAAPDESLDGLMKDGVRRVIATDEQGREWHHTDDSEVGDWLRFQASDDFAILAHDAPQAAPAQKKKKAK